MIFFLFLFIIPVLLIAQQPDSNDIKKDTVIVKDSLLTRLADTAIAKADTGNIKKDTVETRTSPYYISLQQLLKENQYLNTTAKPVAMISKTRTGSSQAMLFYLLATLAALFGFFRYFYTRYFNNLFRVFFNSSLRQSQLTDQLLQAKLPSLFFNILFVLAGGTYIYLVLRYYGWINNKAIGPELIYCALCLGGIYLIKYVSLKFTGWLTSYVDVTNTYVFIIFLINKILGILLIPFSIIIAFAMPALATSAVLISLLFVGLMFLLRFFRSYGLLQNKLKISRFHFLMYVVGIEIIPVLLIYKGLVLLLSKNL